MIPSNPPPPFTPLPIAPGHVEPSGKVQPEVRIDAGVLAHFTRPLAHLLSTQTPARGGPLRAFNLTLGNEPHEIARTVVATNKALGTPVTIDLKAFVPELGNPDVDPQRGAFILASAVKAIVAQLEIELGRKSPALTVRGSETWYLTRPVLMGETVAAPTIGQPQYSLIRPPLVRDVGQMVVLVLGPKDPQVG